MIKKRQFYFFLLLLLVLLLIVACSSKTSNQDSDILAGTTWLSDMDYSLIVFNEDESFEWYQSEDEKDDNYYAGTYTFYIGQDAVDYITGPLAEYNVTEKELQAIFRQNEDFDLNNFVCYTINNESFILDGEEQISEPEEGHYFGFLREDGEVLDVASLFSGTYSWFIKQ